LVVGGGPAPGINGVISAVTIEASNRGIDVFGIEDGYKWLVKNAGERLGGEQRYQFLNEVRILHRLNGHGQLHCGRLHFDGGLCALIHSAIHNVGPMDKFRYWPRIETEVLLCDHRDKAGARLERRIVELVITLVLLEVGGVIGGQESALMMVKPPRDLGRTGIL
jgi:hypothetical protein